jgi:hypothetical protein
VFLPSFTKTNNKSCGDEPQSVQVWLSEQDGLGSRFSFFSSSSFKAKEGSALLQAIYLVSSPKTIQGFPLTYFYLHASLILAKADCRLVVQG